MAALSWNASIFSGTRRATALPTPLGFCFSSFSCTPDFTAHTQNYIRTCTQSTFFFFFFFPLSEIETCKRAAAAAAAYGAHFCTSGLMLLSSRLCSAHHCFWMGKTKQLRCCSFAGREWKKHAAIVLVNLGGGGGGNEWQVTKRGGSGLYVDASAFKMMDACLLLLLLSFLLLSNVAWAWWSSWCKYAILSVKAHRHVMFKPLDRCFCSVSKTGSPENVRAGTAETFFLHAE